MGQSISYENLSFDEALAKAKRTNQIVFVQLESDCSQCNTVDGTGLSGEEINNLYARFICIKIRNNSDEYRKILHKYYLYADFPTSLFVNREGHYLASLNNFSTSNKNEYFKLAAKAMASTGNPPFKTYTEASAKPRWDRPLLKEFITKLSAQNFDCDSLLEKYVDDLTIKELSDESELVFLIRSAPLVNSRAYYFMRQNYPVFKKVFESLPMEERIRINQKILAKSKSKAFRDKDQNYIYSVSSFLRGMYGDDKKEGNRLGTKLELEFYKAKKDYNSYYNIARVYYNGYYSRTNIDSIIGVELSRTIRRPDGGIQKGGVLYQTGSQLNDIAFTIYEFSEDKEQLGFALKLSEKTLRYKVPEFIDTYARILYRFGGRKDAIDWQRKAVAISDSLNLPSSGELKEVLAKMQAGTL